MADIELKTRLVICSKTAKEWETDKTVIMRGEMAIEIDTMKLKVGNGVDVYADLPYFTMTPGEIQSLIGHSSHTHNNFEILNATTASFTTELLSKLNGIAEGANKTTVDASINGESTNPVQNKIISAALDSKVPTSRKVNGHSLTGDISITATETGAIPSTEKASANGVATLDENGKIPAIQLPGSVDEIIEGYYNGGKFYKDAGHKSQITGESSKIYVNLENGVDHLKTYRWSGSMFVVISDTITVGTSANNAFPGDKGQIAYEHSQSAHAPSNAERNIIIGVQKNGADIKVDPSSRKVNISVPTTTGELTNNSDFVTSKGTVAKANQLTNPKAIDGVNFDGTKAISHFGICSSTASTVAKVVTIEGFTLNTGARATIKFSATNSAASPTLNVTGTGAKPIQYKGTAIPLSALQANHVYEFVYDGTAWQYVGDVNTDTHYSAGAGLKLSGTQFQHSNSITAGTAKGSDTKTLNYGESFAIPSVTYDAQGHITGKGTTSITLPTVPTNVASATKLQNKRSFSITGKATAAAVDFDGTSNVALNVTGVNADALYQDVDDVLILNGNWK